MLDKKLGKGVPNAGEKPDFMLKVVPFWILLLMHVPTALKAEGSMLRGSSALLTEARLNYSPGNWINISGGRVTEKTDQLPLRTY